ncbi:transcription initiation factor TFIID subunit 11-like [Paramacrobiotus metropolitanus]|uniref:transcription initiation factor TFIID subunit 11-like n=1 Tax=Paramacrobiotus metropolitanus TaxID=2943436 RepID=UPI002445D361|nr:transcription initiation factor TFIID subunit 11-like [Paramacrobiotus metropolitanus]XP_055354113.1 transcription initiation factor TFIID subunit 11-like [Paramacrobiotus metropolitanus]XP_055354114.1 transcription initiation factor TFIID subunit 11-like [Paramacrobiotus metropolitanus]
MLSNGFPTVALFAGGNEPVAYCMYLLHGCIGAVYVHHAYRNRSLFKIMLGHLLAKLRLAGVPSTWVQTMHFPLEQQLADLRFFGGTEYTKGGAAFLTWVRYTPTAFAPVVETERQEDHVQFQISEEFQDWYDGTSDWCADDRETCRKRSSEAEKQIRQDNGNDRAGEAVRVLAASGRRKSLRASNEREDGFLQESEDVMAGDDELDEENEDSDSEESDLDDPSVISDTDGEE